jgi:hypothetical protein
MIASGCRHIDDDAESAKLCPSVRSLSYPGGKSIPGEKTRSPILGAALVAGLSGFATAEALSQERNTLCPAGITEMVNEICEKASGT